MKPYHVVKYQCTSCGRKFYAKVEKIGKLEIDDNLCLKYQDHNRLLFFLAMCPHCNIIKLPGEFPYADDDMDEDLPFSEDTCDKFERLIEQDRIAQNTAIGTAYLYHKAACCRKMEGLDYSEQLEKANFYYRKAKEQGMKEFYRRTIDEWIEATES